MEYENVLEQVRHSLELCASGIERLNTLESDVGTHDLREQVGIYLSRAYSLSVLYTCYLKMRNSQPSGEFLKFVRRIQQYMTRLKEE